VCWSFRSFGSRRGGVSVDTATQGRSEREQGEAFFVVPFALLGTQSRCPACLARPATRASSAAAPGCVCCVCMHAAQTPISLCMLAAVRAARLRQPRSAACLLWSRVRCVARGSAAAFWSCCCSAARIRPAVHRVYLWPLGCAWWRPATRCMGLCCNHNGSRHTCGCAVLLLPRLRLHGRENLILWHCCCCSREESPLPSMLRVAVCWCFTRWLCEREEAPLCERGHSGGCGCTCCKATVVKRGQMSWRARRVDVLFSAAASPVNRPASGRVQPSAAVARVQGAAHSASYMSQPWGRTRSWV
jgi:hypothetical protein